MFLIIILGLIFFKKDNKTFEFPIGKWKAVYKNQNIELILKKNRDCELKIISNTNDKIEKYKGRCNFDFKKKPNTFIMSKIANFSSSLYSIVNIKNNNLIYMSELSTRWRLRPISFEKDNLIKLKKEI